MAYYQPSGKISPRVAIWVFVSSIVLIPVAWAYAWLMLFARVGPLILLFAVIFGGCCARGAYITAEFGKARNPRRMAWLGAGIGLIGWYWQWVAWLSLASTQSSVAAILNHATPTMIDFATSPRSMYVLAMQIREVGLVDDSGRSLVKSPGFAWILEVAYATAVSAAFAWSRARKPFCENGDNWGEILALPNKHAFLTDTEEFVKQMEADPRDTLDTLTSFPGTEQGFSTIAVTICRPSDRAFLTVRNIEISVKDGAKKVKDNIVIEDLAIDVALADDLIRQCATGGNLQPTPATEIDSPELQPAIAANYWMNIRSSELSLRGWVKPRKACGLNQFFRYLGASSIAKYNFS